MTTKLTQAELKAIYNLAVGYTESYKNPYDLVNIYTGYKASVTSSNRQAKLGLTLIKGKSYDEIVALQNEKDTAGNPTPQSIEANKLINNVKSSLASSGYSFSLGQFDLGQRGSRPAKEYGFLDVSSANETVSQYLERKIAQDNPELKSVDLNKGLQWNLVDLKAGVPPKLSDSDLAKVQDWLKSANGQVFVNQIDSTIRDETARKVESTLDKLADRGWSESDLILAAAYLEKSYNQSPSIFTNKQKIFLENNPNATLADLEAYTNKLGNKALAPGKALDAARVLAAFKESELFSDFYDELISVTQTNSNATYNNSGVKTVFDLMESDAGKMLASCLKSIDNNAESRPLLFSTKNGLAICDTDNAAIYFPQSNGKYTLLDSFTNGAANFSLLKDQDAPFKATALAGSDSFVLTDGNGKQIGAFSDGKIGVINAKGIINYIEVPLNTEGGVTLMDKAELKAVADLFSADTKVSVKAASDLSKVHGWDADAYDVTDTAGTSLGQKQISPGTLTKPNAPKKVSWSDEDEGGLLDLGFGPDATKLVTNNPDGSKTIEVYEQDPLTLVERFARFEIDANQNPSKFTARIDYQDAENSFEELELQYKTLAGVPTVVGQSLTSGSEQSGEVSRVINTSALGGSLRVEYFGEGIDSLQAVSASDSRGTLAAQAFSLLNDGDISEQELLSGNFSLENLNSLVQLASLVKFAEATKIDLVDAEDSHLRRNGDSQFILDNESEIQGRTVNTTFNLIVEDDLGVAVSSLEAINGQPPANASLINAAIVAGDFNLADILGSGDFGIGDISGSAIDGDLAQLIAVADPANASGVYLPPSSGTVNPDGSPAWWQDAEVARLGGSLFNIQGLIAALKSGKPLPIAVNVFSLAATWSRDPQIASISGDLNAISSVVNFRAALQRGDILSAAASGANIVSYGLRAYQGALGAQMVAQFGSINAARGAIQEGGDELATQLVGQFDDVGALLDGIAQGIPFLNLFAAIANGDEVGIVTASLAVADRAGVAWAGPVGWFIAGVQILFSIFSDDEVEIGGDAVAASNGDGRTARAYLTHEEDDGGGKQVTGMLDALIDGLESTLADQPSMGIIAARLPWLHFTGYENIPGFFTMYWTDEQTGQTRSTGFGFQGESGWAPSLDGRTLDDPFFKNAGQQFAEQAYASGAVAPQWLVRTVDQQMSRGYDEAIYDYVAVDSGEGTSYQYVQVGSRHIGGYNDPYAGRTTEQRARAQGQLLANDPGDASEGNAGGNTVTSQQAVNPIVLDLDGNGFTITTRAQGGGVLLDVDDDGFAEQTDWIGAKDGILVVDYDGDGRITGGHEMFNDSRVNMQARGLSVLNEIDADGDGKLSSNDLAYSQLRIWQDVNHDGQAQSYELQTLQSLGISELNIATGQFTRTVGGATTQGGMGLANLQADSAGYLTQVAGNSLLAIGEAGDVNLYVSATANYGDSMDAAVRAAHTHVSTDGSLSTIDELMDGLEDVALTVSTEQLLDNDAVSTGNALNVIAVGAGQGGTVTLNAADKTVRFTPNANFSGIASFTNTVADTVTGQQSVVEIEKEKQKTKQNATKSMAPRAYSMPAGELKHSQSTIKCSKAISIALLMFVLQTECHAFDQEKWKDFILRDQRTTNLCIQQSDQSDFSTNECLNRSILGLKNYIKNKSNKNKFNGAQVNEYANAFCIRTTSFSGGGSLQEIEYSSCYRYQYIGQIIKISTDNPDLVDFLKKITLIRKKNSADKIIASIKNDCDSYVEFVQTHKLPLIDIKKNAYDGCFESEIVKQIVKLLP